MRQVTGSNPSPSANRMSIQLTLSGHSFSRSDLPRLSSRDERTVEIEVMTDRVMLAPMEIFDENRAKELLAISGIEVQNDERIVIARDQKAGLVAIMALPRTLLATVEERYGRRAEFTTPLLRTRLCTEPTAWLFLASELIYIKVWSGGKLRMAEVLLRKKTDDVLYYATVIDKRFTLNGFKVVVTGTEAVENDVRETSKLLSKFYKKVICE